MSRLRRLFAVSAAVALLSTSSAMAQSPPEPRYEVGKPLVYANLTVAPLYTTATDQPADDEEYLTLLEATKSKAIEVTELEGNTADAQVAAVHVTNTSQKAIFLMAGEVILGGKQDRIISNTTVLEPGTTKLELAVFCVEKDRWDGRTAAFKASGKIGHSKLRGRAAYDKEQDGVWDEVATQNAKSKTAPETSTYKASLEATQEAASRYVVFFEGKLAADARAVGVVVAINGKPVAIDAFANPRLFGKLRPALLESYALEAVTTKGEGTASAKKLKGFVTEATTAKEGKSAEDSGDIRNDYTESTTTKGSKARRKSREGVVQESYFAL